MLFRINGGTFRSNNSLIRFQAGASAAPYFPNWASAIYLDSFILLSAPVSATYQFGASIAMNETGDAAFIASPGYRANITPTLNEGAFSILSRSGDTWTQHVTIYPSASNTNFGSPANMLCRGLACNYAGSRLIVGAVGTGGGLNPGAVFFYDVTSSSATFLTSLTAGGSNFLGFSVDMSPDGTFAVAGAPGNITTNISGFARAYEYSGSAWSVFQSTIEVTGASAGNQFGASVALSNEGKWLALGGQSAARIGIFSRNSANFTQQEIITETSAVVGFGRSLRFDKEGIYLAVGSPTDSEAGTGAGAVYIYKRTVSSYSLMQKILPVQISAATGLSFGTRLSMNSDGNILVIRAGGETVSATSNAGAVYIYTRSAESWTFTNKLLPISAQASNVFGTPCISFNGTRLLIGEPRWASAAATTKGRVQSYKAS